MLKCLFKIEFKSTEVTKVYQQFAGKVQPLLIAFYRTISDKHLSFVNDLDKRYAKFHKALKLAKDKSEKVELQREFKKELLEMLTKHGTVISEVGFEFSEENPSKC